MRHPAPALPERDLRRTWQAVSLLLDYPSDEVLATVPAVRALTTYLPGSVGAPLAALADHLAGTEVSALRSAYVDTFDTTRRCALHLTYFSCGDTRKRGIALVQLKDAYRRSGMVVTDAELPDHLCVLLEFGAAHDPTRAWKLLCDHRAGIELLWTALRDKGSPWQHGVAALRATLPVLDGTQEEALARLIALGPPAEEVGLDGYALDPALHDRDPALHDRTRLLTLGARS